MMQSALSLLKVGIDLDGVLNNMTETVLAELKRQGLCPTSFSTDDIKEYWFEKNIPGLTKEQVWEVFRKGDVFWNANPLPHAQETLAQLNAAGVQVHIVTSRGFSQMHREITEEWLRRYGFGYHRLAIQSKKEKAHYAQAHRLDLFIEDHLPTAQWMADIVRLSILLDAPHNQFDYVPVIAGMEPTVEPANLVRMFGWKEIQRFFFGGGDW